VPDGIQVVLGGRGDAQVFWNREFPFLAKSDGMKFNNPFGGAKGFFGQLRRHLGVDSYSAKIRHLWFLLTQTAA